MTYTEPNFCVDCGKRCGPYPASRCQPCDRKARAERSTSDPYLQAVFGPGDLVDMLSPEGREGLEAYWARPENERMRT